MNSLYNIYAKSDKDIIYDENIPFRTLPSEQDIVDWLNYIRPFNKWFLGSVRINYLRELKQNEL